jgi:hypothetical protein
MVTKVMPFPFYNSDTALNVFLWPNLIFSYLIFRIYYQLGLCFVTVVLKKMNLAKLLKDFLVIFMLFSVP